MLYAGIYIYLLIYSCIQNLPHLLGLHHPPPTIYMLELLYISRLYVSILIRIPAHRIYRISLACTTLLQLSPQGAIKTVWMNKRDHLDVSIPLSPPLSPSLSLYLPLPPSPSCLTTPSFILFCLLSRYLCFLPVCLLKRNLFKKTGAWGLQVRCVVRKRERKEFKKSSNDILRGFTSLWGEKKIGVILNYWSRITSRRGPRVKNVTLKPWWGIRLVKLKSSTNHVPLRQWYKHIYDDLYFIKHTHSLLGLFIV